MPNRLGSILDLFLKYVLIFLIWLISPDTKLRSLPAPDDVIQDTDVRYWMLATEESHDLESSLAGNPYNIQLWMKLAYKKLYSANGLVIDKSNI